MVGEGSGVWTKLSDKSSSTHSDWSTFSIWFVSVATSEAGGVAAGDADDVDARWAMCVWWGGGWVSSYLEGS